MAEGFSVIVVSLLGGATLVGLFSVMGVLFPRLVDSAQRAAEAMPGRSLLLGLVNVLFLSITGLAFSALGDGLGVAIVKILAVPPFLAVVLGLVFGLAAMSPLIGERLAPHRSRPAQIALGASVMILGSLAPFVGWFGLFPYVAFRGFGGFVIWLFGRAPDHKPRS